MRVGLLHALHFLRFCDPAMLFLLLLIPAVVSASDADVLDDPQVDTAARQVLLSARVAKQGVYDQLQGTIEYLLCCSGGKEYEALFITQAQPAKLFEALQQVGLKPGKPARETGGKYLLPEGGRLRIFVKWIEDKEQKRQPVESFVLDTVKAGPMPPVEWAFTGSRQAQHPETGEQVLEATLAKNLISLHHLDPSVLIQNPLEDGRDDGRYKANLKALPKEGTWVTLILENSKRSPGDKGVLLSDKESSENGRRNAIHGDRMVEPQVSAATLENPDLAGASSMPQSPRRIHWRVSGKVQGVGFRMFTQRMALSLGIRGWVRNLPSGEVELAAEGAEDSMKEFEKKISTGPRGAKVEKVTALEASASEALPHDFEVRQD